MSDPKLRHAEFDENDHCTVEGWATYHTPRGWRGWLCRLLGHKPPTQVSRHGYGRCARCRMAGHLYRDGEHRHGGYDRDVFESYKNREARGE